MVSRFAKQLAGNRKGQGLVEYGILAAGVALIALVSVSVLGHKTSSMIGTLAAILPGTESSDSGPVTSGSLIETQQDPTTGNISINPAPAADGLTDTDRLDNNTGVGVGNTSSVLALDPDATN